eukprot:TRINITY_DN43175_c0_g1_i2.p1 TRINITY_DN43175_c0_g1~~TRINITY_DN43175_c0_g1_i2.p1  ORF type:complete len:246 (+),score=38.51 TRINITY_DN43175_c0_g1_i2:161-898(+)
MQRGLVGSEMCIRDRYQRRVHGNEFSRCEVTLLNRTGGNIGFKVKTNAVSFYNVKPHMSLIPVGGEITLQISAKPVSGVEDPNKLGHVFIVEAILLEGGKELKDELFLSNTIHKKNYKLPIKYYSKDTYSKKSSDRSYEASSARMSAHEDSFVLESSHKSSFVAKGADQSNLAPNDYKGRYEALSRNFDALRRAHNALVQEKRSLNLVGDFSSANGLNWKIFYEVKPTHLIIALIVCFILGLYLS